MSITVQKYKQSDFEAWDKFVDQSNNGTLFHLRLFLSYHHSARHEPLVSITITTFNHPDILNVTADFPTGYSTIANILITDFQSGLHP